MAVVLIDGFDTYNGTGTLTGIQSKWVTSGTAGQTLVSGRFGGQAWRGSEGSGTNAAITRDLPSNYNSLTVGFAFRNDSSMSGTSQFLDLQVGGASQLNLALTINREIVIRRGTTVLATSAANAIAVDTYQYVELSTTINDTTGSATVYVEGASVCTVSGADTKNQASAGVAGVRLQSIDVSGSGSFTYFDDLYVSDSTTPLGPRRISTLYPDSDVAQGFTRSTGSTNYTLVDEAQVNGDTDYVQGSTVGDVDTYGFGNLSTTPTAIDAVQVIAYALKTDVAVRSIALQVKSGGTTSDGSDFALGTSYGKFERLLLTDPNTSAAWTASAVNALQGGPKVTV